MDPDGFEYGNDVHRPIFSVSWRSAWSQESSTSLRDHSDRGFCGVALCTQLSAPVGPRGNRGNHCRQLLSARHELYFAQLASALFDLCDRNVCRRNRFLDKRGYIPSRLVYAAPVVALGFLDYRPAHAANDVARPQRHSPLSAAVRQGPSAELACFLVWQLRPCVPLRRPGPG